MFDYREFMPDLLSLSAEELEPGQESAGCGSLGVGRKLREPSGSGS